MTLKKKKILNIVLTAMMLLSTILTPQISYAISDGLNGEDAEKVQQVDPDENENPEAGDVEENIETNNDTGGEDSAEVQGTNTGSEEAEAGNENPPTEDDAVEDETPDDTNNNDPPTDGEDEEGEDEGTEETVSEDEEVAETEEAGINATSEEISTSVELSDDEIFFENILFTDAEGNEFSASNPYDLEAAEAGRLSLDWSLPEGHTVTGGDTYTFNLPAEFTPVAATNGPLGDVGEWTVNAAGVVTFTFNDNVDGDDVAGHFWFEITLVEEAIEETIEQEIAFPVGPEEYTIDFNVQPKGGSLIDKRGSINNEGYNSNEAYWELDINTGLEELINASVTDEIPNNMTFQEGSLVVHALNVNAFGERSEGVEIVSSKYSVSEDGNGNPEISLDNLADGETNNAYRVKYTTDIVEPDDGFDGTQTFTNNAVLTNNGESSSASSTVSSGYGQAIEKGAPEYNSGDQTFDWTIDYNFNQKYIDADQATINDTWSSPGTMELERQNLDVYTVDISPNGTPTVSDTPISADEYTLEINDDNSGFYLGFNNDIDGQAYQIQYQTNILGQHGDRIIDDGGEVSNSVETGTEMSDGSSGTWGQQGLIKNHVGTDVSNKTIDWEIELNQNGYQMDNLVLEDSFSGDGLTLMENLNNFSNYELTITNNDGVEFTDYTLYYTDPDLITDSTKPGSFTIDFDESINEPLNLSYTTHFERNSDGTATYGNNASIDWKEGENSYETDIEDILVNPDGHTAANGVKNGNYNATNQQITWEVNTNFARLPIQSDYEITDQIPENQVFLEDTLEVYSYEVDSGGGITYGEPLEEDSYTVDYPDEENGEELAVTLNDSYTGTRTAIGLRFNTEFANEWMRDEEVINTANITNGDNEFSLDASVEIPHGGEYASKKGAQAGEFNERVDWSIELNPNQSRISNYTLTDNPDLNSVLMEETFVLYEATVDEAGEVSKTETESEEGTDYNLDITTNNETGDQEFVLQFTDEITQAYVLEYSSYIDPMAPQGEEITNDYIVEGENIETLETTDHSTEVIKQNAGGGDGTSIRGGLTINKEDEAGGSLAGARFELYNSDGSQLLRSGTTNEVGQLNLGGLRRGNYLLREVNAPEDYVISDELATGVEIELAHDEDGHLEVFEYTNDLTQVEINKVDEAGEAINEPATFTIYDELGIEEQNVTTMNGSITVEDLEPGNYYLEEQTAPDGYIRNTEHIPFTVEINDDGTQTVPVVEVVNYRASVQFEKVDELGNPLQGATFDVETTRGEEVRSGLTSDENGIVRIDNLVPGNYRLIETAPADGYIQNGEELTFNITDSVQGEPEVFEIEEFVNYQGKIRLTKTDDSGNPLAGAVYEIQDAEGNVVREDLTTGDDGRLLVLDLAPGEYTFIEVSAPDDYVVDTTPIPFKINERADGDPAIVNVGDVINYQGSVVLEKTDVDGAPLENAEFGLYENIADGEPALVDTFSSNEDGLVEVENLVPGNYTFVETDAPTGYVVNTEEINFTIEEESEGEPVQVEADTAINYQGSVILEKTNVDGDPLEGAEFNILDSEGEPVRTGLLSDDEGIVSAEGLAPGDYTFVETQAPEKYVLNETEISFEINEDAQGEPVVVEADPAVNYQGSVEWTKTNEAGEPLEGISFNIIDKNGEIETENVSSDKNGQVSVSGLAPGTYTIVETETLDDYLLNTEEVEFTIDESAEGEPATVAVDDFVNYQGSAQMMKVNEDGEFLPGAVFEVHDADGETVDTVASDENARVLAENLAPGDYTFVEVSSPDGYITNTEPIEFSIGSEAEGKPEVISVGEATNYQGSAILEKTDAEGNSLEDAEFELLDIEGTQIESNLVTDENGQILVEDLAPGDYVFRETVAPKGYIINEKGIEFTIEAEAAGEPVRVEAGTAVNYQGSVVLEKVNNEDEPLSDASFDILDTEGKRVQSNLVSDENGQVHADSLAPGDYVFVETKAPEGYVLNETETPFTINESAHGQPEVVETAPAVNYYGSAEWQKVNEEDEPLEDAQFNVIDEEGTIVRENVTSDSTGRLFVGNLEPGTYTIEETTAVEGYLLNTAVGEFTIEISAEGKPEVVVADDFINYKGSAQVIKVDTDGEILPGAVFEVHDEDGNTVDTITSDENGRVLAENLAPGDYNFVEVSSPDEYITNTEPVGFTIESEAQAEPEIVNAGDLTNYQGSVVLEKVDAEGNDLEGAEFEIRDLDGELIQSELISDAEGLVYAEDLAPGNYEFIEVTAPEGYLVNEKTTEFTIDAENTGEPERVEAGTAVNYQGSAELEKADVDGNPLEGAVFNIIDSEDGVVQSNLTSNEDGLVYVEDLEPGEYRFKETQAPNGYVLNETEISFEIDESALGEPVSVKAGQAVNYQGSVEWLKVNEDNESLEGVQFNVLDEEGTIVRENVTSDSTGRLFVENLEPGTYTIVETETTDNYILNTELGEFTISTSAEGKPEVVVADDFVNYQGSAQVIKVDAEGEILPDAIFEVHDSEGNVVDSLTSDENGRVLAENLAPGDYTFIEIESPDGYMTNTQPIEFTIADEAEGTPEVVNAGDAINYQGSVILEKIDAEGNSLEGAEFDLLDTEGNLIQNGLISDENGEVTAEHLAPGNYVFRETKAPAGYVLNETEIQFDIDGEAVGEPVRVEAGTAVNYQGSVVLEKVNSEGEPLSGATFDILDAEGKLVQSNLISDKNGQVQTDSLAPGDYVFVETNAPEGYVLNETETPFTINDSAEGEPAVVNAGTAINYKGSVEWQKVVESGNTLTGAQFNVMDENGTIVAENVTSDEEGRVTVNGLAPGTYTIFETETVDGHILNTDRGKFVIDSNALGQPETVIADNFVNYQGKVQLTKTDDNGEPLAGAVFTLQSGETVIEEELVTDTKGQIFVEGLAPGDYTFVEISAPEGYITNSTPVSFNVSAEFEGEPAVIKVGDVVNYQGTVSLEKVDTKGNPLAGAVFEIRDSEGNLIQNDLVSDKHGQVVATNLAPGEYVINEVSAPEGYLRNMTSLPFTIDSNAEGEPEVISIGEFTNYQGSQGIIKTDQNGNPLAGAEFTLLDQDGNEIRNNLTSDEDGRVFITGLAPGKYTLVETDAPEGYMLSDENYTFEIEKEAEGEPETLQLTIINEEKPEDSTDPSDTKDPKEPTDSDDGDDESGLPTTGEAVTYTGLAVLLLIAGIGLVYYDRKSTR